MAQLDLTRLRKVVLDNRRSRDVTPSEVRRKVFVTPGGRVVIGDEIADEGRELSEVHQAVFAAE
jgi:hypothetical protein